MNHSMILTNLENEFEHFKIRAGRKLERIFYGVWIVPPTSK